jgi:hypothetical protein
MTFELNVCHYWQLHLPLTRKRQPLLEALLIIYVYDLNYVAALQRATLSQISSRYTVIADMASIVLNCRICTLADQVLSQLSKAVCIAEVPVVMQVYVWQRAAALVHSNSVSYVVQHRPHLCCLLTVAQRRFKN